MHDGSWLVGEGSNGNHQVRMNVITPPGQDEWKNVEITGYVKVIDTASGDDAPDMMMPMDLARGCDYLVCKGRKTWCDSVPCEALP